MRDFRAWYASNDPGDLLYPVSVIFYFHISRTKQLRSTEVLDGHDDPVAFVSGNSHDCASCNIPEHISRVFFISASGCPAVEPAACHNLLRVDPQKVQLQSS